MPNSDKVRASLISLSHSFGIPYLYNILIRDVNTLRTTGNVVWFGLICCFQLLAVEKITLFRHSAQVPNHPSPLQFRVRRHGRFYSTFLLCLLSRIPYLVNCIVWFRNPFVAIKHNTYNGVQTNRSERQGIIFSRQIRAGRRIGE